MVGGTISGGSMNPARVFGPALASGHFDNHYIWWLGPIAGGVLAGLVYKNLFAEKKKRINNDSLTPPGVTSFETKMQHDVFFP